MKKTKKMKTICKISLSSTHVNVEDKSSSSVLGLGKTTFQNAFVHPEAKICLGELFAKPATMWVVWINALGWRSPLPECVFSTSPETLSNTVIPLLLGTANARRQATPANVIYDEYVKRRPNLSQ